MGFSFIAAIHKTAGLARLEFTDTSIVWARCQPLPALSWSDWHGDEEVRDIPAALRFISYSHSVISAQAGIQWFNNTFPHSGDDNYL